MTYKRTTQAKPQQAQGPLYNAYTVSDAKGEGQKGYWTKIGAMFAHEDGDGGTLVLDALPLGGRIVLRTPKRDEA